jgi:hypothetical protein
VSFTAAYSKLYRLSEDGSAESRPPKILDMDAFEQAAADVSMSTDTVLDIAVTKERTDRTEYPEKTYKHLFGFKTWTPQEGLGVTKYKNPGDFDSVRELFNEVKETLDRDRRTQSTGGLGYFCNIERFGVPYGTSPEEVLQFFARVSEATEPFVVWHSSKEHDFVDLHDMDANDIGEEVVYRIECRDGEAEMFEVSFERTGEEMIAEIEGDTG